MWRPKSTEELVGTSTSILADAFGIAKQYNSIMDSIAYRQRLQENKLEQKNEYYEQAIDNVSANMADAMSRGDRETAMEFKNQLSELGSNIQVNGAKNMVTVKTKFNTAMITAKDFEADKILMDEFDKWADEVEGGLGVGKKNDKGQVIDGHYGMFTYDWYAEANNKEDFQARVKLAKDTIRDKKKELEVAGISNVKAYTDILNQQQAVVEKMDSMAGFDGILDKSSDAKERQWYKNARTGQDIQTPTEQFQNYANDRDRLEGQILATTEEIAKVEKEIRELPAQMVDPAKGKEGTKEEIMAQEEALMKQLDGLQKKLDRDRINFKDLDSVIINKRYDWTGIGEPLVDISKKENVLKLNDKEREAYDGLVAQAQGLQGKRGWDPKDDFTVNKDGNAVDKDGNLMTPKQLRDLERRANARYKEAEKEFEKSEIARIEKEDKASLGEENYDIAQKYKIPTRVNDKSKYTDKDLKDNLDILRTYEDQKKRIDEQHETLKTARDEINANLTNIKELKEDLSNVVIPYTATPKEKAKLEAQKKKLQDMIKKEQESISALKKKHGKKLSRPKTGSPRIKGEPSQYEDYYDLTDEDVERMAEQQSQLDKQIERTRNRINSNINP